MKPWIGFALVFFLFGVRAHATLGESVDTIEADRAAFAATGSGVEIDRRQDFTVHVFRSAADTIREYVSTAGTVFAVAWTGYAHPNLDLLLGSYSSEFRGAEVARRRQPGHRSSEIASSRLVVERWGHMRKLEGRAYDPALIPDGVSTDEIR